MPFRRFYLSSCHARHEDKNKQEEIVAHKGEANIKKINRTNTDNIKCKLSTLRSIEWPGPCEHLRACEQCFFAGTSGDQLS